MHVQETFPSDNNKQTNKQQQQQHQQQQHTHTPKTFCATTIPEFCLHRLESFLRGRCPRTIQGVILSIMQKHLPELFCSFFVCMNYFWCVTLGLYNHDSKRHLLPCRVVSLKSKWTKWTRIRPTLRLFRRQR